MARRRKTPPPVYFVWSTPGGVTIEYMGRDVEPDGVSYFARLSEAKKAAVWAVEMGNFSRREERAMKEAIRYITAAEIKDSPDGATLEP